MEDDRLQDLAASVADGRPVDWQQAEEEAGDEEMKKVVRALREISEVAQAHQSWHESLTAQASREGEPVLEHWGNLVILEKVGEGSFGEVFRARDPQLDREVALKLLRHAKDSGADQENAVIEEGRLLARVRHPYVATVYGADRRDGRVGLWMEFLQGRTLAELVREQGPLGAIEAVLVGLGLCRALAAVYAKGILHRDIKAQNVMRETGGRFVLMDFGVGRDLQSETSPDHTLSGTPLYLAPEVLAGGASSVRSDIYSLGVLLFYLVTGTFPVLEKSLDALREAHDRGEVRLLRDLRPALSEVFVQVIDRALLKDPNRRYASAGALEQALQEALRSGPFSEATEPRTVLIADFNNRTGQQFFDSAVRHLVSIAFSQSPNFRVVPYEQITQALKRMMRPLTTRLDSDTARELCLREEIPIWVSGEIVQAGSGYSLTMSAVWTESGKVLAFETIALQDPSELIHKIEVASGALRRRVVGERRYVDELRCVSDDRMVGEASRDPALRTTGPRTVVIADFNNRTGQQFFDSTVRHLVSTALSQSPNFRVLPYEQVTQTLDSDTVRDLLLEAESLIIWVSGEIVQSGSGYSLTMSAVWTENGKVLAFETIALQDPSELIHKIGVASEDLRRRLGEPEALIRQNHRRLE
jgi:serine/threonine protein kinase